MATATWTSSLPTMTPTGGTVTLFMGDGAGNFKPSGSPFATGAGSRSNGGRAILVNDFNGDGKPDLVVASAEYVPFSGIVNVLLNDGQGNFQPPRRITSSELNPVGIAVGDFDRDGNPDLAIANFGMDDIAVLLGDGQGGFAELPRLPLNPGFSPCAIAVGDFNGDSAPDLAVASCQNDQVVVWLGNGSGHFDAGQPFAGSLGHFYFGVPDFIAVADFNGDGNLDLALSAGRIESFFFGNGTGNFTEGPSGLVLDILGLDGVVGDFNGDGKLDVANVTRDQNNLLGLVTVFLGDGAGGLTPIAEDDRTGSLTVDDATITITSLAVGDFNEDGRLDIVADTFTANPFGLLEPGTGYSITGYRRTVDFSVDPGKFRRWRAGYIQSGNQESHLATHPG